jgi:hypothetical protein
MGGASFVEKKIVKGGILLFAWAWSHLYFVVAKPLGLGLWWEQHGRRMQEDRCAGERQTLVSSLSNERLKFNKILNLNFVIKIMKR